ncbi:MAG: alpha/beta hydrolase [Steroidobacteraceae bacterium]
MPSPKLLMGAGAIRAAAALMLVGLAAPQLPLSPCELEHPLRLTVVPAQCGWLSVAENPQDPAGRHIRLRVARVPAINRDRRPDALFILAGGPGMAATAFYAGVAPAFARIHRDRDIVLVDQRGTGGSNPLTCREPEELLYRAPDSQISAATARCLASLAVRANVAYYTTSIAVQDLEQVRAALGYERIDLYGGSYGTRVAQHYLRRFPARVRSVILDGVVPVQLAIGPDTPLDAEGALRAILARCAHDDPCRSRFGDPLEDYRRVRAVLAAHPVPVSVSDPQSGAPVRFEFSSYHLATVLRLLSYTPEYAALLPLILYDAGARADFAPLAAQFLMASRGYGDTLALGMHNSVVCTEDVPFYDPRSIDRARLAPTFLGTAQLDGLAAVCRVWPRGAIDADFHAPLTSDVPALLLSGGDDPVTPPRYAAEAARGFPHGLVVVLAGFGHGQLTAPCMDRVLAQFLARASASDLDIACTRGARPLPFFTSVNGPAP